MKSAGRNRSSVLWFGPRPDQEGIESAPVRRRRRGRAERNFDGDSVVRVWHARLHVIYRQARPLPLLLDTSVLQQWAAWL